MGFFSWLRSRTPRRPAGALVRPRLEELEDRWLPSQLGLTVSSLADSGPGTLRAAVLTADAGSSSDKFTITVKVPGTIDLQSPLPDLNNSIAIQGPGASSLTVERAAGYPFTSAIVTVDVGQTVSLSGLTIANGNAGGIVNNGTLSVSACTISGNSALKGGGIFNGIFGAATINQCTLSGNSAIDVPLPNGTVLRGFGGAIYNVGTMTVSGCTLSSSSASTGGAISNSFAESGGITYGGTLTVRDSLLIGNSAGIGGAIYNSSFSTLVVRGSTLSGNSADFFGGGLWTNGTATLQECSLFGNSAGSGGGGILAFGTLTVKDSTVLGNFAPLGADLDDPGVVTLKDSTVGVTGP